MSEVAAILLAAGSASRYRAAGGETTKLVAEFRGRPLARVAAEAASGSRAKPLVVVTGFARESVEAALDGIPARFAHNANFASGLASSLKAGVAALPDAASGALILLADMPRVTPEILDRLIAEFAARPDSLAVIPTYRGERGNPVLLARALFAEVATLRGDEGARRVLKRMEPSRVVEVAFDAAGVALDVDTPGDLAAAAEAP